MERGFTLMEVIIVIGLLSIFAVMGLAYSFDSYRGYLFRSEYTSFVHILAKARNQSVNNFNESSHGVAILDEEYHLFTEPYDADDESTYQSFPRNAALTYSGPSTIEFEQLSGNLVECTDEGGATVNPCSITFAYELKTKNITVNDQGGITW